MSAEMSDYVAENKLKRPSGTHHSLRLQDQVRNPKLWPTPTTQEVEHPQMDKGTRFWLTPGTVQIPPKEGRRQKRTAYRKSIGRKDVPGCLSEQVATKKFHPLFPTPRAREGNAGQPGSKGSIHNAKRGYLDGMIQEQFPTPQASDHRDRGNLNTPAIKRRQAKGKQLTLSMSVSETSGQLNPTWVEWLMGYPSGWTDLED
jgi:hypothetical protein